MASDINPYDPCLCGSGKKIKFCCHEIIPELVRIINLLRDNQTQQSLQAIDALLKKPLKNAWSRAFLKMQKSTLVEGEERIKLVDSALEDVPDHPRCLLMKAANELQLKGFPAARPVIEHSLLQLPLEAISESSPIISGIGYLAMIDGHPLAASKLFMMAVVLNPDEANRRNLSIWNRQPSMMISRLIYPLVKWPGAGTQQPAFDEAMEAANRSAYFTAAQRFEALARKNPNVSRLWYNAGVSYAFAADDAAAISALRTAAACESDFEQAVDYEVIAQTIEVSTSPRIPQTEISWEISSVSELLGKFDGQPNWWRNSQESGSEAAAEYLVLSAPAPTRFEPDPPVSNLAQVTVFDRNEEEDEPARVIVTTDRADLESTLITQIQSAAGDLLTSPAKTSTYPKLTVELEGLLPDWFANPTWTLAEQKRLQDAETRHIVQTSWPSTPRQALGGKTPQEASKDPALRVPLAAAIAVLDYMLEVNGLPLDRDALRQKLGLPPTAEFEVAETDDVSQFSLLDWSRASLSSLSATQFVEAFRYSNVYRQRTLRERVLQETLSRTELHNKEKHIDTVYAELAQLCNARRASAEALAWLERARKEMQQRDAPFAERAPADILELRIRSANPDDPQLAVVAQRIWQMSHKVPEIQMDLTMLLQETGLPGPWNTVGAGGAEAELVAPQSTLWTPGQSLPAAAGSESKLWVPD